MDLVRIVSSVVFLAVSLTLAVCTSSVGLGIPSGPPALRGAVEAVRHSATASGVTVRPAGAGCATTAVVAAETRVFRRGPDRALAFVGVGAAGAAALEVGLDVEAWTDGPASCDEAVGAVAVVLLP